MAVNLIPILLIGGAVALMGRKKRKKKLPIENRGTALPPPSGRGTVFEGDGANRPSGIQAKVGERFSVAFMTNLELPGYWKLNASPPDNSIKYVGLEHDSIADTGNENSIGEASGKDVFIFEGSKLGSGSLVFHWQVPWLEGKEPPAEVVEILTEIS